MRSSRMGHLLSRCSLLFIVLLITGYCAKGQKFHFGGSIALVASQVDGDNLRGFNKLGYSAGLLGGYSFSPGSWLVVDLQYSTFGSNQRKEQSPIRLETDFRSINILCGYALRFGDAWDGSKKFRVMAGLRMHSVQKAVLGGDEDRTLVDRYFISLNLSLGLLMTENWLLDLSYNQGMSNILKNDIAEIDKLIPYYISLGVLYYLHK